MGEDAGSESIQLVDPNVVIHCKIQRAGMIGLVIYASGSTWNLQSVNVFRPEPVAQSELGCQVLTGVTFGAYIDSFAAPSSSNRLGVP